MTLFSCLQREKNFLWPARNIKKKKFKVIVLTRLGLEVFFEAPFKLGAPPAGVEGKEGQLLVCHTEVRTGAPLSRSPLSRAASTESVSKKPHPNTQTPTI